MSSIYIQEPPTSGKVLLVTSVGDIDVELWCKEAPKACRNFVQLCLEGHYDNCQFLRVVPGFIAQCGDPDCEGDASRNIYGKPFRDEFHSRLRFVRRGLLAMANAGRNDNGTQFFFTLNATPELQNKHTVFGKVTGNTLYNMLKLEEGEIQDDRPVYPQKILRAEVLLNPFDDMVPRKIANSDSKQAEVKKPKSKSSATKNFKLLSFGDEAEEDEEETIEAGRQFSVKSKSSHDLTDDPRLSSVPAVLQSETSTVQSRPRQQDGAATEQLSSSVDSLRKKLKKDPAEERSDRYRLFQDENDASAARVARAKEEYTNLKKEMLQSKRGKEKEEEAAETKEKIADTEAMREYKQQLEPFRNKKSTACKKGSTREQETMAMLAKFKSKLFDAREQHQGELPAALPDGEEVEESDETWMWHRLEVQDGTASAVVAKDANTKKNDWYDINDPRNDINQRRRQQKQTQS